MGEATHATKGLVRLTMACNERCPFCNVPVEDYSKPTPELQAVLDEVDACIASGEQTLTVSGGEPTLYRARLLEVVARARAGGVPFVEIQTNAVLIDDGYARALSDAGATSAFVSLLSDDAAQHDFLAGLDGAFQRCLGGIDALVAANVAVTLNPVVARCTQDRVAAYVDFVARRLPAVRTISLSAVQPHGRARSNTELLPDYDVLGAEVRRARARAQLHGIVLLNPYCGLPLCVGWSDDDSTSVEATEAAIQRLGGSEPSARGLDNHGNKRQGPECRSCALRTRCGGAWLSYFELRAGAGLVPPLPRIEPWRRDSWQTQGQRVVYASDDLTDEHLAEARTAPTPTVWLLAHHIGTDDMMRARVAGVTDLALWTGTAELAADTVTLDALRALAEHQAGWDPQHRLRVVVGLERLGSFQRSAELIRTLGPAVDAVRILGVGDPRRQRFAAGIAEALQIDVGVVDLTDAA
jgi:MoaA/NifB/PqqE/SkfB family radical SAM enzyme